MRRTRRSATQSASGVERVDASDLTPDATSVPLAVSREELLDALTCPISGKLFVDPVTAVCGHTFSRRMLSVWMNQPGRQSSCPTCRAPLYHESPHQWPVNTTIADLCERFLDDALAEARSSEPVLDFPPFDSQMRNANGVGTSGNNDAVELPLFVLDPMIPGQEITLNVFEERYKRMVRRVMQHTRRFGMVAPADAHHEGAAKTVTTREQRGRGRRRRVSTIGDENELFTSRGNNIGTDRVYASSEEEEDGYSRGDSDDGLGGSGEFTNRANDPFLGAGPFAFNDFGVECVVTAFQESIDGRVLVRCRATRHVRVISAREDEAGYAVARVTQVTPLEMSGAGAARPELAAARAAVATPRARNTARKHAGPQGCAPNASVAADADHITERTLRYDRDQNAAVLAERFGEWENVNGEFSNGNGMVNPRVVNEWTAYLRFAGVAVATNRDTRGDEWHASRQRLRMDRAVGAHRVWLAHVSGRPLESFEETNKPRTPWTRGSKCFFKRSYGGKPENLLALCGERPRADRVEELSWWLARVANPLPPLGAAVELRGAALSTSSATRRFSRIYGGLHESLRSVHKLEFSAFRGARPVAGAAVATAWCRAMELCAKEEDAYVRSGEHEFGYQKNNRLANRKTLARCAGVAIEIIFKSGLAFPDLPDDVDRDGTSIGKNWPAMGMSPIPTNPYVSQTPFNGHATWIPGDTGNGRAVSGTGNGTEESEPLPRVAANDVASTLTPGQTRELKKVAAVRFAFLVSRGGAPRAAWELYRHLSRFGDDEFETLASQVASALAGDDPPYRLPDDFPRPGDTRRAALTIGVVPGGRSFLSGGGGSTLHGGHGPSSSSFRGFRSLALFPELGRFTVWRVADFVLAAFIWVVAGIGHLLFSVIAAAVGVSTAPSSARRNSQNQNVDRGRVGNHGTHPGNGNGNAHFTFAGGGYNARNGGNGGVGKALFAATCATILFWVLDSNEHFPNATARTVDLEFWNKSTTVVWARRLIQRVVPEVSEV